MSGSKRVNLEEVKGIIGCNKLKMTTPKEVLLITGYTVGSVSLMISLPCIVDRALFRYPFVYGGTGEPASTLKIVPNDLKRINQIVAFLD